MGMTNKKRVLHALQGKAVDRIPVTAWMHFPFDDETRDGQVRIFTKFQKTYDWDLMKLMFRNTFHLEDWGCAFEGYHPTLGYWLTKKYAINDPKDWEKIGPLDPLTGAHGEMVSVTGEVCQEIARTGDAMKLATVFSPLMVAHQLAMDERIQTDIKENREALHKGLETITRTVAGFAKACLDAGADGIFFATGEARAGFMSKTEYREFGHPYNIRVLDAIRSASLMTMLHICGQDIFFDEFLDYPIDAFNWDTQNTSPDLGEARKKTDKCIIGGMSTSGVLFSGTPEDVRQEAAAAVALAGKEGFILGPGCGVPFETPPENLKALREVVEK
jgi:uroporphyrinogen decarboxylase